MKAETNCPNNFRYCNSHFKQFFITDHIRTTTLLSLFRLADMHCRMETVPTFEAYKSVHAYINHKLKLKHI